MPAASDQWDTAVGAVTIGNKMTFSEWCQEQLYDEAALTPTMRRHLEAAFREENPSGAPTSREEAIQAALTKYTAGVADHGKIGRLQGIAAQAINEGWDEKRAGLEMHRCANTVGPMHMTPRGDRGPAPADVLVASLCVSAGAYEGTIGKQFDQQTMDAAVSSPHRGATLHTLVRSVLAASGRHVPPGRITDQNLREAFAASREGMWAAGGSVGTYSLPILLGDSMRKLSLAAFNSTAATWPLWCRKVDLADFHTHHQLRLINAGQFKVVAPGGELKYGSFSEQDATLTAATYGEILAVDRKDFINDNLNKLSEIPRILGRNSSILVEKKCFTILMANAGNFFHANNKNLSTGAGSALALAGLDAATKLFLQQVDANGDPSLIVPQVLLVPPALDGTARSLTTSTTIVATTTANAGLPDQNAFAGRFTPICSAYLSVALGLTGNSDTAWYLLAPPGDFAVMAVGFLNGQAAPTIEDGTLDFDKLGVSIRGYIDFDAAFLEPKGGVKSAGT